jgi:hypothetical protein
MIKQKLDAKRGVPKSAGKAKRPAPGGTRKPPKNLSSREKSATQDESSLIFSKLKLRPDGPPGPRIPIGEALRQMGLDEFAIASTYVHVVGKLTAEESDAGGVHKLLVDVLKECSRQIEASQPPARANADAPVIVQLVHAVSRPARAALPPPADGTGGQKSECSKWDLAAVSPISETDSGEAEAPSPLRR